MEDFGYGGDEFLIGDCREDWGIYAPEMEFPEDYIRDEEFFEGDDYDDRFEENL